MVHVSTPIVLVNMQKSRNLTMDERRFILKLHKQKALSTDEIEAAVQRISLTGHNELNNPDKQRESLRSGWPPVLVE